jgi:signal transduction histidine kinase
VDSLEAGVKLTVLDNGCGIPQARFIREGMGLRSMAERAKAIGAEFVIRRRFNGGTEIACTAPDTAGAADA